MKHFLEFLTESILDPEQPTLSPQLFDLNEEPRLKQEVRNQIIAGIAKLSKVANVLDYTLIGSTLTRRYTNDSDIDINVLINATQDDYDSAKTAAIENSGKLVAGTKHPINYHVLSDKSDFDNANESADGVFDISKNEFIRKPIEKPFHVDKYFSAFKDVVKKIDVMKDELKDDLIDYSVLKTMSKNDAQSIQTLIKNELEQIESDVKGLSALHDKIIADRNAGFQKKLTAKDIREYGTKNRLPGNVVYKLLERYHYLAFLHEVEKALADGKVSDKDAENLLDVVF
jgi:predicted nucleotidyltransferase